MLNADVLAVIKSYGLTSLDVADAVRELKREGVAVPTFKLRDLSKLCFIIQLKFIKKRPGNISYGCVQAGLDYEFLQVDRYVYLLAFKLLGFRYTVDSASFKFRIEAIPLQHSVWCLNLRRMYIKDYGWCPFTLMEIVQSKTYDKQKILEMRLIRNLF